MATVNLSLSSAQQTVLVALKRRGEATADELAAALGISASAVRQHLGSLRAADLVEARRERGQPGRPADRYRATERTESLFVTGERDLSAELLGHLAEEDPALVGRVFDRRREHMVAQARRRLADLPIEEQIEALSALLDEQGYLADVERIADNHWRMNLHNCAIWNVANQFRQACSSELDYLRDLIPDATVDRITHKTAGAHTCAYDIRL